HAAHVADGSGAGGGGARSRIAQAVSPPLSSETQSRGQSGRGPQISRTTLLDAARTWPIQRSFASRAARGCPWSAQARPQVLIGRSRIPHEAGCSRPPLTSVAQCSKDISARKAKNAPESLTNSIIFGAADGVADRPAGHTRSK